MRILHVISTLAGRAGGPPRVVRPLVRFQFAQGHQVTICTTNRDYPTGVLDVTTNSCVDEGGVGVWYHAVDFKPLSYSKSMRQWLMSCISDYDVVHIHGLYRFPTSFAAYLARSKGIPYVIQPHGSLDLYLYNRSSRSLLLKRLYEKLVDFPNLNAASRIVLTSVDEEERVRELGFTAPGVVVPNGLDLDEYRSLPARGGFRRRCRIGADVPLVLFLGRLNFKKGIDLLIPAFAQIVQEMPSARLAIVGPDNEGYEAKIQGWVSELSVENEVVIVDYLEGEGVLEAYVDADVFVLSSYTENFGLTVIEAMACECPVIVSDQVNICKDVDDAGAGIVTNLDPLQIAAAIGRIIEDKELSERMGKAGRELVAKRFDWRPLTALFSGVYEQILDERRVSKQ